jgi:thioester reductase-like protein
MPPGWKNTGSVDALVRKHREARLRLKALFDEISALGAWLTDIGGQLAEKPWDLDESELRQLAGIADLVVEYKQALVEFEDIDEKYREAWGERS